MKTVLVCGTFDIVHLGHLYVFREARSYGDRLVALVARDVNVEHIKGHKPLHSENERVEFLQNISLIDEVVLGDTEDPYSAVCQIRPQVIALGYDQKLFVDHLAATISDCGFEAQIVRLRPHNPDRYKTGKLKAYLAQLI